MVVGFCWHLSTLIYSQESWLMSAGSRAPGAKPGAFFCAFSVSSVTLAPSVPSFHNAGYYWSFGHNISFTPSV
jgi:hypothetical protein